MSVHIITDSTTDLTPNLLSQVHVVPLTIMFGDKSYVHGVDINNKEFYERLVQSDVFPTTSQPTPAAFEELYRQITGAGDTAVVITISNKLSGTYQSATIAAADYEGKVFVVNSKNVAIGTGVLVEYALDLAAKGMSAAEITEELIACRDKVKLVALLDTLEYLKKGGRISSTVAFAGGLLNIKPIIGIVEGEVKLTGTTRGTKQRTAALMKQVESMGGADTAKPFMLGYTGTSDAAMRAFIAESSDVWGENPPASIVGCAVGVHAGPDAVAAAFFAKN